MGNIIMVDFALNGTYYITGEFYLRPSVYVCIMPEAAASLIPLTVGNNTFIPRNGYGYIECVNGSGPVWLNVTLGPGAYTIIVAIYGHSKPIPPNAPREKPQPVPFQNEVIAVQ